MNVEIGKKVRLKFTGESGVITANLGDGMVQVRLDTDFSALIPAFQEDLIPFEQAAPVSPTKGYLTPKIPAKQVLKSSTASLTPKGVGLAFVPQKNAEEWVLHYQTWLLNDSPNEFIFEVELFLEDTSILFLEGKIQPWTIQEVGNLQTGDLNDAPEAELLLKRVTTAGVDDDLLRVIKIKPKQFVKNYDLIPIINSEGYFLLGFDLFDPVAASPEAAIQSLQTYTKQKVKRVKSKGPSSNSMPIDLYNLEAIASFEPEIDLHIHVLMPGYQKLNKSEILQTQLRFFHDFMNKAIRLGVPKVFIIHGVGEGKLKEAVANELRRMPYVKKFKNEYIQKYGYGATEVHLD
jgi:hypothetical protein